MPGEILLDTGAFVALVDRVDAACGSSRLKGSVWGLDQQTITADGRSAYVRDPDGNGFEGH